jgi:hypothetical protein
MKPRVFLLLISLGSLSPLPAQIQVGQPNESKFGVWLPLQLIPSMALYNDAAQSNFSFEWEVTPLLYSFGMNDQISPWYSFIVEPTARFVGSVEVSLAGQVYTTKLGQSYFSSSGQLMGFIPLAERGEHLTLNIGLAAYRIQNDTRFFKVVGISSFFGMLHLNLKHAENPSTWIGSLEFRIF